MRTTRRQMTRGGALLAGAALLLTACGGGGGGGDDAQSITWWSPNWDTPAAEQLIAEFEEENPGVTVELVETTNESLANQVRTALDSGNGPDLMTELVSRIPLYISRDQLMDVSDWYDDSMPVEDFNSEAVDAVSADDGIYAVPWRWDASGYLYNVDLFAEAGIDGPPATWDELLEDAATIHDQLGIPAFGWPYGSDSNTQTRWLTMYYTFGGDFTPQEDGTVTLDAEASERALEALAAGFAEGWASQSSFESDNTALQNLFINGQLAFYFDGSYAIEPIEAAGVNVGTAMWPGPDGPGTVATNGWAHAVPSTTENVELVEKFVQFLNTPENQAAMTLTLPARISAADDPKFEDPLLEPFITQQNENGRAVPAYPGYAELTSTIFAAVQSVALGQATAEAANQTILDQAANVLTTN